MVGKRMVADWILASINQNQRLKHLPIEICAMLGVVPGLQKLGECSNE